MGRAALDWTAKDLGQAAGTSTKAVRRFEKDGSGSPRMISRLASALEAAGIVFSGAGRSPGVSLLMADLPDIAETPGVSSYRAHAGSSSDGK